MDNLRIFSFNCRGLADKLKRKDVLHYLKNKKPHIVCLQDVHWIYEKEKEYRDDWGFELFFSGHATNSRGVAVLFNNFNFEVNNVKRDDNGNAILINVTYFNYCFNIINIYGPNNDDPLFFENLVFLLDEFIADFDIICGDWNLVQDFNIDCQYYSHVNNPRAQSAVFELKTNNDLVDPWRIMHPDSQRFTWRRTNPFKQARLDFFLISQNLMNFVFKCDILPAYKSDHSIVEILLSFSEVERGTGFWKFNHSLIKNDNYVKLVNATIDNCIIQYAISEEGVDVLSIPVKDLKFSIDDDLFFETLLLIIRGETIKFSSIQKKKNKTREFDLEKQITALEKNVIDQETFNILNDKKQELEIHRKIIMNGAMIRSKANWVEWGEKPSSFFLNLEKRSAINKTIHSLRSEDGTIVKSSGKIREMSFSFYKKLYSLGDEHNELTDFIGTTPLPKLSKSQRTALESDITMEDLTSAVNRLKADKSPGLDGFNAEFIKFFWNRLGPFVLRATYAFRSKNKLSISLRRGVIVLLPKKDKPRDQLSNWRPICLLSIFYKIISTCIADKLKIVLPNIIHEDQKGFMSGRHIGDSIRLISDVLFETYRYKIPGQLFLIDFAKAFDSISHNYLWNVLNTFGFGPKFINWCKLLYNDACSCILINGSISDFFPVLKGCRQGDPLSPYLFILGVEILACSVRHNNNTTGLTIYDYQIKLTHYADDTTFILDGDPTSLETVMIVLDNFAKVSGLVISWNKSKILWIGSKCFSNEIHQGFRRIVWDPGGRFSYLGLTFTVDLSNMTELNYSKVLSDINKIMCQWGKRRLTPLGRITVVKTLIIPKLNYLFINLPNPDHVTLNKINSSLYKFVWGGQDRVSRTQFCQNYDRGGVKMVDIKIFLHALKLIWVRKWYSANESTMMRKQFTYFIANKINFVFDGGAHYIASKLHLITNHFYRDVLLALIEMKHKIHSCNVRDKNVDMFLWLNDDIKIDGTPYILNEWYSKGIHRINDLLNENGAFYNLQQFTEKYNIRVNFLRFFGICQSIKACFNCDTFTKQSSPSQPLMYKLLIKNYKGAQIFYSLLNDHKLCVSKSQQKWTGDLDNPSLNWSVIYKMPFVLQMESKYSWFQYRINTRILATNSYLYKINISGTDLCSFCHIEKETIFHLFCFCSSLEPIWNMFFEFFKIDKSFYNNKAGLLLGIESLRVEDKALNKLLIWFRYFIYKAKYENNFPNFNHFLCTLKYNIQADYCNAKMKNKLSLFFQIWDNYLELLNINFTDIL